MMTCGLLVKSTEQEKTVEEIIYFRLVTSNILFISRAFLILFKVSYVTINMYVVTDDNQVVEFDASRSRVLVDIQECQGVPRIPIHSHILSKLSHDTIGSSESWETLVAMLRAADFLNMPDMLDALGRRMADMLHGKPPEQVREMMAVV